MTLEIKPYLPGDAARWDEYVKRHAVSSFCHFSGWQRVIERTWRHQQLSLIAERDGGLCGLLPLFHIDSRWFGSMLISTPNAVYGGAIADDAESHRALIESAKALAVSLRVDYLELRNTALTNEEVYDRDFHRQNLYVSFDHPIASDEEALMKSFPRDVRRMIRLGIAGGLRSQIGREELLDDFYEVYATSLRNLGTPVFPKKLFAEFLREFPASSDILLIRQNGRIAAGVLSFYFRDTVMPYYGGAYREFNRAGVNNFMYWELMRLSAARGFTRFDFGRSKIGTGAYQFKSGWRMTERSLPYKFLLVRSGKMPNLNPTNPNFKLMIEIWKRMPLGLTKMIGPKIVKHLL